MQATTIIASVNVLYQMVSPRLSETAEDSQPHRRAPEKMATQRQSVQAAIQLDGIRHSRRKATTLCDGLLSWLTDGLQGGQPETRGEVPGRI